jgi:hypothetical protein
MKPKMIKYLGKIKYKTKLIIFNMKYFECIECDYKTHVKCNYDRHIKSKKHKIVNKSNKSNKSIYKCPCCCKTFNNRTTLWRHKNKCDELDETKDEMEDNENELNDKPEVEKEIKEGFCMMQGMFCELIKSNQQLATIIQNGTNHITNNNINNNNTNNFNLNFFLNETCKDAINLKDFIKSIEVSIMDLKKLGNKGYVEGISSLMIDKLNELDVTKRPIHSTDVKRNSIYIKDDDEWEKDEKEKLMSTLWDVARLETRALESKYKKEYPKCETDRDSREHEEYWRIFYNAMGGKGGDIEDLQRKVVKKIVQNVAIDKMKVY